MRKLALSDDILLSVDKPARYIGGELNSRDKNLDNVDIRFVMCFPDVYEIGMSHIGIQILYDMLNSREDTFCERLFSPWVDLDKILREKNIPLFSLESQEAVKDADFLGITLQYEMCYTNILQVLELSQIPIYTNDRGEEFPIVIGGGPCAYNPEPLAPFFDIFYIGEGEVVYDKLLDLYKECKKNNLSKNEFLLKAAQIDGASSIRRLFSITIPMMMPSITICTFLSVTNGFKLFDQNLSLTAGEPSKMSEMLALNIYNTFYGRTGWEGVGQAKAVIFFIVVVIIGIIQLQITRGKEVQQK